MQSDQYRAITESDDRTWVFHGGPGTGKTIIAAHRACYLTNEARGDARLSDVLILGPTEGYVHHVRPIVDQLDLSGSVTVRSLPELLSTFAGLNRVPSGSESGPYDEVDPERFEDCLTVAHDLKEAKSKLTVKSVYQELRRHMATSGSDMRLPVWDDARTWSRYLPIIASCAVAARVRLPEWQHIIVDEAQDIRPLEWVLISHMTAPGATFTLLGDMHQRRHPTTYRNWRQVSDGLRQYNEDMRESYLEVTTGYRSTKPIFDFATRLIPKNNRHEHSPLQDGPPVGHVRARDAKHMWRETRAEAATLAMEYPRGTVAIITTDISSALAEVRRAGGKVGDWTQHQWVLNDGAPVAILEPNKARGLEFDAVVVVEPADFPRDEFGSGLLFTSLTRANKELRIVHSRALPDELHKKR